MAEMPDQLRLEEALQEVFLELGREFLYNRGTGAGTPEHSLRSPMLNGTDLHILIAEDDLSHAVILRRWLERGYPGARVEVVGSIRAYLTSIAAATPTIVLLDLNLVDGCTLDMLKDSAEPPPFPVIMLSSHAEPGVADEALQAGALDFIIKTPEVFSAITGIVEKAVREWGLRAEGKGARRPLS